MEDEGIFHAVDVTGAVGKDTLGNLAGLGSVVVVQTHSYLQLEGVSQLGPLGQVAVEDDVLLGHHHLGIVLEDLDIIVQFGNEEVIEIFYLVILGGEGAAVTVLGRFGVLDITVDIDGIDGTVDGQNAAHGGISLGFRVLEGLDILVDAVPVGKHGDVSRLTVHTRLHAIGTFRENTRSAHLAPQHIGFLVVEPEGVVIGLKQRLSLGGQEGGLLGGHGCRVLVELGKLFTARSEANDREQGQCNE